ncbi:SDR family oxidoreductase [Sinorhizobium meliloti]|uniref:SDR family oxidoreductase n=1 Tax=Rhizobium meliloti TaxID=382 RepID=UPI0009B79B28|nr:SDR family oxidoreductase [Sinorhizobium medicae]MDX1243473.1 SDR family oxidoreductase [Sinorhizobium medicae]
MPLGTVARRRLGSPTRSPYAASQRALVPSMKPLAIDIGQKGVRVNAIMAGALKGAQRELHWRRS